MTARGGAGEAPRRGAGRGNDKIVATCEKYVRPRTPAQAMRRLLTVVMCDEN